MKFSFLLLLCHDATPLHCNRNCSGIWVKEHWTLYFYEYFPNSELPEINLHRIGLMIDVIFQVNAYTVLRGLIMTMFGGSNQNSRLREVQIKIQYGLSMLHSINVPFPNRSMLKLKFKTDTFLRNVLVLLLLQNPFVRFLCIWKLFKLNRKYRLFIITWDSVFLNSNVELLTEFWS